jgi:hypothetical protein
MVSVVSLTAGVAGQMFSVSVVRNDLSKSREKALFVEL